jgi:hypothetical protein
LKKIKMWSCVENGLMNFLSILKLFSSARAVLQDATLTHTSSYFIQIVKKRCAQELRVNKINHFSCFTKDIKNEWAICK